jgi:hypothetical protein
MSRLLLERAATRSSQESRRKAVFVMTPLGSHNIVIELVKYWSSPTFITIMLSA